MAADLAGAWWAAGLLVPVGVCATTLVARGALAEASGAARLGILNDNLNTAAMYLVEIPSRFRFEQRVFQERATHELSAADLNTLMHEALQSTYGGAIDPATYNLTTWASKPHYYMPTLSFYNFPYTFGWIFSQGLYAVYQRDPEAFWPQYDTLLSDTGRAAPTDLATRLGIDLRDPGFWHAALAPSRDDVDEFERMAT